MIVFLASPRAMVTTPFIPGFSTRLLLPILAMGISMPWETMVAVKFSGGAANAAVLLKTILAMKTTNTAYLALTIPIPTSLLVLLHFPAIARDCQGIFNYQLLLF
jgi:hypothetical protein